MPLSRLAVLVGLIVATAASAAPAAPFAYVTNSGSASVSVVDIATNAVSGPPIAVRGFPGGVVVNADATRVYVSSWGAAPPNPNIISVIETASRSVIAEIPLAAGFPAGLALTPDGSRLFVTHSVMSGPTLTVINTAANTVMASMTAGRFNGGVVVHPNGSKLYIATGSDVLVYHPVTLSPLGSIMTGNRAYGLALDPAGGTLYVANYSGSSVSVVDTASDTVRGEVFTGLAPFALSVSPDGGRLFVGNQTSRTLSVVDTGALTVLMDVPLGAATPYGVQSGPDGSRVYVADYPNNALLVIDAADGSIIARVAVGAFPIAFGEFIRAGLVPTTLSPGGVSPSEVILGSATPVSLRAVLTRTGGVSIAGATIAFFLDGVATGSALTGADGAATLSINPAALSAGPHGVSARFAGGAVGGVTYGASSAALGTLRVVYRFTGFLPPLKEGTNTRGAGALILARWRLSNAVGVAVGDLSAVVGVYAGMMPCGGSPSAWSTAAGTLTYDAAEQGYTFRWKTDKTLAGTCARLSVALADGTARTADFSFR